MCSYVNYCNISNRNLKQIFFFREKEAKNKRNSPYDGLKIAP